jgi:rubrerythrin
MNRRDLMARAYKGARDSLDEMMKKYTCPKCGNDYLFDPDMGHCSACGYKRTFWEKVREGIKVLWNE